jgi:hypothetical protein
LAPKLKFAENWKISKGFCRRQNGFCQVKILFCQVDFFPFPKYQKKKFGGKKINLTKKFFNLAKKVGPSSHNSEVSSYLLGHILLF